MPRTFDQIRADLSEARAKRDRISAEMNQIHERAGGRALAAGEQQRWERLIAGIGNARADAERYEDELRDLARELAESGSLESTSPEGPNSRPLHGARTTGNSERDQARRVIDQAFRSRALPDYAAERATALVTKGRPDDQSKAARWAIAAGDEAYQRAFAKLLADPVRGHMTWDTREQDAYRRATEVRTAMSLTDANGGYMVPLTLDPAIMLTNDGSNNPLRQLARVVQTATDQWQGVTSAGATAEWKAEGAQAADGSPTVGDEPIPVYMGDVDVIYSYEVGMDAVDFLGELRRVILDAGDNLMATAYTTGTGTGQPTGIVTGLAGTASEINTTGSEAIVATDATALQNALPARFSANASWQMHIATMNTFAAFETTNGALRYPEMNGNPPMLLRKPLHENSNMDGSINAAATANNYVAIYGDVRAGFVIADRIGATLEILPGYGANNRPTGQRHAFLTFRTGSAVVVPQALRMLDVPTTA